MTTQATSLWTTEWVDSMDRKDWQQRAREALDLDGVEEVQIDPDSGQVKVRYHPQAITSLHIHTHLRAAGL